MARSKNRQDDSDHHSGRDAEDRVYDQSDETCADPQAEARARGISGVGAHRRGRLG